jgi:hypothetical protein
MQEWKMVKYEPSRGERGEERKRENLLMKI